MYNPYVNFTPKYFPNSKSVVDSFHVVQWINHEITLYINKVKKRYKDRDQKKLDEENKHTNRPTTHLPVSKEVYLINNYRYFLLSDIHHIKYSDRMIYNRKLRMHVTIGQLEKMFLDLDPHFREIRDLKQLYLDFNNMYPMVSSVAEEKLVALALLYSNSEYDMFRRFGLLLKQYKEEIINSFCSLRAFKSDNYLNTLGTIIDYNRRMSNGPMEGYNRQPKDLKRSSRGTSNFEYTRKRLIWANRKNESIRPMSFS